MACDESGEPSEKELVCLVRHIAVNGGQYVQRALCMLEIVLQGVTNRVLFWWAGAATVLGEASREAACLLWSMVCSGIAECKGASEALGCMRAFCSSLQAASWCLGLLCLVGSACCKAVQGTRDLECWCWAMVCAACKGAAEGCLTRGSPRF